MKRSLISLFIMLAWAICLHAQNGDFNPENPGDPQSPQTVIPKHLVSVSVSPTAGGTVNYTSISIEEGGSISLYAYNNTDYEFIGWYTGDKLESQNNPVTLTMRKKDITLTARFQLNPVSPGNPGTNYYEATTGTLIIDHFTQGKLSDVINSLVGNKNYDKVKTLTVVGEMSDSDYGIIGNFSNLEMADLSRTSGYTALPSNAFSALKKLQRIVLPATIESIRSFAFSGCSSLNELVLYSPVPPTFSRYNYDPFSGVSNDLIVRVPVASLALYQSNSSWNTFDIQQMIVRVLNVTIPKENLSLYNNMFLELFDNKSGQLFRYVITQRDYYSFSGIFEKTTYQLTLRNAQHKVFGQEMVSFSGKDTTVSFTQLFRPVDLSVKVLNDKEENVTEHTTITWRNHEGNFLTNGTSLPGQVEGDILCYQIALDDILGVQFKQEDSAECIVADIQNKELTYRLKPLEQKIFSGVVIDSATNKPVKDAKISVVQQINNQYVKIFSSSTSANGSFSIMAYDVPADIEVFMEGYRKKTVSNISQNQHTQIKLEAFQGTTIKYSLIYQPVDSEEDADGAEKSFDDFNNVVFSIYNQTKQERIREFENNFNSLQLLQKISIGDSITVTASSNNYVFEPVTVGGRIIEDSTMTLRIPIVEKGGIFSSFAESAALSTIALLYDKWGQIVQKSEYINQQSYFVHLPGGEYTLFAMENNSRYSGISHIDEIERSGLEEGEDYVKTTLHVRDGVTTTISFDKIPVIRQKNESYVGDGTGITANKTTIVSGNYLTLRGKVNFKSEYLSEIKDVRFVVELPDDCQMVEDAVMVGSSLGKYSVAGNEVEVPLSNVSDPVKFCIIPTIAGEYRPSAYVRFSYKGDEIVQPIGSANYIVENAGINVPPTIASESFTVSGMTNAYSDIMIYADNVLIGKTKATGSGLWGCICELPQSYNMSSHIIYAQIITPEGATIQTDAKECVLDRNAVRVSKVTAYHPNPEMGPFTIVYDFINANPPKNQWTIYYPNKQFTYTIDFTNNDPSIISNVVLYIHMADGQILPYVVEYNENTKKWSVDLNFGSDPDSHYPVNCSVDFDAYSEHLYERAQVDESLDELTQYIEESMAEREEFSSQFWTSNTNNELDSLLATENADINRIIQLISEDPDIANIIITDTLSWDELVVLLNTNQSQYDQWEKDSLTDIYNTLLDLFYIDPSADLSYEQVDLRDTLDGVIRHTIVETLQYVDTADIIKSGYVEIHLLEGKSLYYKSDESGVKLIDAQTKKYYAISNTDYENTHNAPTVRSRKTAGDGWSIGQECSYSLAGIIREMKQVSNSNSFNEDVRSYLSLFSNLATMACCYYNGSRNFLINGVKQTTRNTERQLTDRLNDINHQIAEITACEKRLNNDIAHHENEWQRLEIEKSKIDANTELSAKEKELRKQQIDENIQRHVDAIEQNETRINKGKRNLEINNQAKKQTQTGLDNCKKNVKTWENYVNKYLPVSLSRNTKIPTRLLRIGGSLAGSLGTLAQFIAIGLDAWEAHDDMVQWVELEDAIDKKLPCPANQSEAETLQRDIYSTTWAHMQFHISILLGETAGLTASQLGALPGSPVWYTEQAITICTELGRAYHNGRSLEDRGRYYQAINNLRCSMDCPNPPCNDKKCGEHGMHPCPSENGKGGNGNNKGGQKGGYPGGGGMYRPNNSDDDVKIDPSGYVYEAISENRVEGVRATIYFKDSHENIFGEMIEDEVLWNAKDYEQENPLYTDAQGMYRWDVPQGLWQVRFEKEGYEPTRSEWLPVPPPQLEVNIPIVQLRQPEVNNALAYKDAVDISFDKYMQPELLNTENIFITANNQKIAGNISLIDEQHAYGKTSVTYASKIRFVPESEFTAKEITLTVSNRVRSYADVPMAQTFQQTFDVVDAEAPEMEKVQSPIPSIVSGTEVANGTQLTLSCATANAVIRYTTDGSMPDCEHGIVYNTPIVLSDAQTITIRAIACANGYLPSEVVQWVYTIKGEPSEENIHTLKADQSKVSKLFRDGILYIIRDNRIYTVTGQEVN